MRQCYLFLHMTATPKNYRQKNPTNVLVGCSLHSYSMFNFSGEEEREQFYTCILNYCQWISLKLVLLIYSAALAGFMVLRLKDPTQFPC